MFSAGGKRNNNCAGTPHFHGWRVASTKSTAFFLVCTHILPARSVAEGYPGSMQKRECVCVSMSITVCNCEIEWNDQTPAGLGPNKNMPPPAGSFPRIPQLGVNTLFWCLWLSTQFLGGFAKCETKANWRNIELNSNPSIRIRPQLPYFL